jgi:hypothetical protein
MSDFDQFWQAYPRRIGKIAARKAFDKAIKNGATLTQILAGIGLYLQYKPVYADYCHPASWLNAGRWMDEWAEPIKPAMAVSDWFDECQEIHKGACGLNRWRHMTRVERERMSDARR